MNKSNAHLYLPLVQALVDGKEVQCKGIHGDWEDQRTDMGYDWSYPPESYRIKPWSLTRHIPGFRPLRDGEEWFDNGWREELLPEGYRPLLRGELPLPGDEYSAVSHPSGWDTQTGEGFIVVEGHRGLFHRTRRPLPEPPKLVPLGPSDWLKDGPWWIAANNNRKFPQMVTEVDPDRIEFGSGGMTHERAMTLVRTNDGINWHPCSKTS